MQVRSLTFGIGFNTNMSPLIGADRRVDGFKSNVKKLGFTIDKTDGSTKKFGKNSSNAVTNKTINKVGKFNNELKKTSGITNGLGNSFGRLKTMVIGFLGIKIAKDSIMGGSDLSETRSKFQTVFGDTSADAEKWVNEMSDTWGRSRLDLMTNMASSQDLLTGFGMGTKQATEFSKVMTEIPTHIASFGNISDKDALENFRKGILGSHEALEMLGIKLRDDSLNVKALDMGYSGKFSTLSEIEKIKIRLALATDQSKNSLRKENGAIGDAAITAKGFANQLKRLWGNVKDISSGFGLYFTPALAEAMIPLNKFLSTIRDDMPKLKPYMDTFINGFKFVINIINKVNPAVWKLGITVITLTTIYTKLNSATKGITIVSKLVKLTKTFSPIMRTAFVIGVLVLALNDLWVGFHGGKSVIFESIKAYPTLTSIIINVILFYGIYKGYLISVAIHTKILNFLNHKLVKSFLTVAKSILKTIAVYALKTVAILKSIALKTLQITKTIILTTVSLAGAVAMGVITTATWAWSAAMSANPIGLVIIGIGLLIGVFVIAYKKSETFRSFINLLWDKMKGIAKWVKTGFVSAFSSAFNIIGNKIGVIFKKITGFRDALMFWKDKEGEKNNIGFNSQNKINQKDILVNSKFKIDPMEYKTPYDLGVIKHKSAYDGISEEKNKSIITTTNETNSKSESKVKVIKYADKIEINVHDSKDPIATAKVARKEFQDMIDEYAIQVEE